MSVTKLGTAPLVGLIASAAVGYYLSTQLPIESYLHHVSSCDIPARKQLPTDLTRGRVPQVDNVLCAIGPIYNGITSNRMNMGSAALVLSVLVPLTLRQGYVASSPNVRSSLLGPGAVLLLWSLGQATGHGFAFAGVGTLIHALGLYQHINSVDESIPLVPTPAGSIYWVNLSVVMLTLSAIAQGFFSQDGANFQVANLIFLTFPMAFAFLLVLAAGGVTKPKGERQARKELMTYSAEQVSYAFERTWSYYRKAALASMALYWYGLHRLITSIIYQRSFPPHLTQHSQFLLSNFFLLAIYTFLSVFIERQTIRTLSSPTHPVTGKATPKLQLDCQKAIALAPAGNPSLERGTWQPFVAAIIGGPGLAASLWWSGGEEEAGWLARRAWRETSAVQAQKKS